MENLENNNNLINDIDEEVVAEDVVDSQDSDATQSEHHHHHHRHHSSHHRHHSSHHGHRSRRRRHGSKKKKGKSIKSKRGWALVISLCILFAVFGYVVVRYQTNRIGVLDQQDGELSSDVLTVEVTNKEGLLIKDAVNKYLLTDILNPENANITPDMFSTKEERLDVQVPVILKISAKEGKAITYKIDVATDVAFSNAETAYVEATSGIYEFKHLYADTTYYYRVTAYMKEGTESVTGQFETADTPRLLSVDGIYNVRDIGNWRTDSGKKIKQGLLLRGTELDGSVESVYRLTNPGVIDMLEVFDIKTDMDLRAESPSTKDALGAGVKHNYYDMVFYENVFTDSGKETVRKVFSDLANPDNYPIYLHCTYGCDRTGIVCYLLEAMLGVSRGDCLKDYGLSNLKIANIQIVEKGLKEYGGQTLKEQAESYLLSCGVSKHQINSIRNIFLGE